MWSRNSFILYCSLGYRMNKMYKALFVGFFSLTCLPAASLNVECWQCHCNITTACTLDGCFFSKEACGSLTTNHKQWLMCGKPGSSVYLMCAEDYTCVDYCFRRCVDQCIKNPKTKSDCLGDCKRTIREPFIQFLKNPWKNRKSNNIDF